MEDDGGRLKRQGGGTGAWGERRLSVPHLSCCDKGCNRWGWEDRAQDLGFGHCVPSLGPLSLRGSASYQHASM